MDWFSVASDIHRDPRIWRAATDLGVSVPTFVGHYTAVLGHLALQESETGDLTRTPDAMLEYIALWHGTPGAFAAVLRAHFEADGGVLRGWKKRNGDPIARAKEDRDRKKREYWNRKNSPQESPTESPQESPKESPQESPSVNLRSGVRTDVTDGRTDSSLTSPPSPQRPAKAVGGGWPATIATAWLRRVGVISAGRVGKDLKPFKDLYPSDPEAEAALLQAVEQYANHCRRNDQTPKWPVFVAEIRRHIPRTMLPPAEEAAA